MANGRILLSRKLGYIYQILRSRPLGSSYDNFGRAYAGILAIADISVDQTERDVILKEPVYYLEGQGNYETLPYQSLFLPASLVSSIAVVYDDKDERTVEVGTKLFKEHRDEQSEPTK